MIFLLGIVASSIPTREIQGFTGEEGTIGVLNASMGFSAVGIMGSGWTWSIHNSMLVGSSSMCATEGLVQWVGDRRSTVEQSFRNSLGTDRYRIIRDNLVPCAIYKNGLACQMVFQLR